MAESSATHFCFMASHTFLIFINNFYIAPLLLLLFKKFIYTLTPVYLTLERR